MIMKEHFRRNLKMGNDLLGTMHPSCLVVTRNFTKLSSNMPHLLIISVASASWDALPLLEYRAADKRHPVALMEGYRSQKQHFEHGAGTGEKACTQSSPGYQPRARSPSAHALKGADQCTCFATLRK